MTYAKKREKGPKSKNEQIPSSSIPSRSRAHLHPAILSRVRLRSTHPCSKCVRHRENVCASACFDCVNVPRARKIAQLVVFCCVFFSSIFANTRARAHRHIGRCVIWSLYVAVCVWARFISGKALQWQDIWRLEKEFQLTAFSVDGD